MNNLIERVIEVVCEYFDVEEDKLLLKRSYASVCDARKFIIYILHCDFGVPASTLAKRFSMQYLHDSTKGKDNTPTLWLLPEDILRNNGCHWMKKGEGINPPPSLFLLENLILSP